MDIQRELQNTIEKLFKVGAHYGLTSARRHPSVKEYLFGVKGGVELFDLEKTSALLAAALEFIKSLAAQRKVILFVGGKAEAREGLKRTAQSLGAPYVAGRWIGGTLTNWSEIKKRLARLEELTEGMKSGELAKYTKRERSLMDREIADLDLMFGGLRGLVRLPDALVVVDPRFESGSVEEANQLNIPVVALLNSDCDRSGVDYPIPGNDASRETIQFVLQEIGKAYSENLAAAAPLQAESPAAPQQ